MQWIMYDTATSSVSTERLTVYFDQPSSIVFLSMHVTFTLPETKLEILASLKSETLEDHSRIESSNPNRQLSSLQVNCKSHKSVKMNISKFGFIFKLFGVFHPTLAPAPFPRRLASTQEQWK